MAVSARPRLTVPASAPARPRMVTRPPPREEPEEGATVFLPSGSHLLNRVLGGGWALGRVANLVGDRSSGKTLLAIEACANFALRYGPKSIRYAEAEAAFDVAYAKTVGMPTGVQTTDAVQTVEQWESDLTTFLEARKPSDGPCMYVLDSLDALSDTAEMQRDMDKGSYGAAKAKKISEMFRKRIKLIESRQCLLLVISQIRDKLNVMFGETKTRSGGRALDFYASQIVWLAEVGKIQRQVLGNKRVIGLEVKARTKKNKVGIPFRDAELLVIFSYGIDDEKSMLGWLKEQKQLGKLALTEQEYLSALDDARKNKERDILADLRDELVQVVDWQWDRIEAALAPSMSKYGS
jgi:recombination protein RecA